MSIAILTQVYDETRRLAIAGSAVAVGDFRLKKLLPPLEQAGAKAPVFARVAEAVKAVVDATEQSASTALLELTSLVNAILYTQGDASAPGNLEPIETIDLGTTMSQASARVLKPLVEALTSTGSGRLELIKDAHERDAFRDLRLIKPALDALDDPYPEIADLIADKVLPIYGKAVVPELRARFDIKGRAGHPRRLRLMHALDPAGTRETVKKALEEGSKEVKVAAIECLGGHTEDLTYLIEQASAKAQEVRQAAYRALASMNDDAAVEVLKAALTGKDLEAAALSLRHSRNTKLLQFTIAGADKEIAALAGIKDKKEISPKVRRLRTLLNCLYGKDDPDTEAFLLKLFAQRLDLAKIKGADISGSDLNTDVVQLMAHGTRKVQTTLAEAHESLSADELPAAFEAARKALPADKVFAMFSPYATAKVDEKKKQRDPAWAKREALCQTLGARGGYWSRREDVTARLDPRWLDIAVGLKQIDMVRHLVRPGHAAANAFLKESFDALLKSSKGLDECFPVVSAMALAAHPDATDAFVACLDKHGKKKAGYHYAYWFAQIIPDLPREAIPRIEALVPSLPDNLADSVVAYLQQLREKK